MALVVFLGAAFVYTIALSCARMAAIADHRAHQDLLRKALPRIAHRQASGCSQPIEASDDQWAVIKLVGMATSDHDEMRHAR